MASRRPLELKIDMSSEQAATLLDRLASDADFRSELESNPSGTLARFGIYMEGLEGEITLPSREDVDEFRRAGDKLVFGPAHWPFMPCALAGIFAYATVAAASGDEQAS